MTSVSPTDEYKYGIGFTDSMTREQSKYAGHAYSYQWSLPFRPFRWTRPGRCSVYDAAGMRVAERNDDIWRFSIYDIGGKLVAEYGPQSLDRGGVKYIFQDWQGRARDKAQRLNKRLPPWIFPWRQVCVTKAF